MENGTETERRIQSRQSRTLYPHTVAVVVAEEAWRAIFRFAEGCCPFEKHAVTGSG